ncbi:ATP-binding protein [Phenylobacterium sp.]|uniref:sensor histidine kinase n=1 Tax=Phenylobacterium sp. TaxID=1871053 RepID=UPI0035AFBEAE
MRQIILQALIMVAAFSVAGVLTQAAIARLNEEGVRRQVQGEAASMVDEWRQKGADHLPHTIRKRARLWRGFEYSLAAPDGRLIEGDPRIALTGAGWRDVASGESGTILTYTQRLPNGSWLSVGQDQAVERRQMQAVARALWLCGGAGVLLALGASYLLARRTWRRVDQLARTAALVSAGDLEVRAPLRRSAKTDDVDDLARDFNGMLDRIVRLVGRVRQVTTDVAHDMRTPLTRVRHRLERLETAAADRPDLAEAVRQIDGDLAEILRTFDAMLQLADIESAGALPGTTDLADVAARVAEAFRPDIEESGRFLETRLGEAKVAGDADLLAQLVANLLENAMRHTPPGTRITLDVDEAGGRPRLSVTDDGPGVPADLHTAALAPFGRLEASRSTPGSGLGLSIAAAVAMRHRAQLSLCDARPGLQVVTVFPTAA